MQAARVWRQPEDALRVEPACPLAHGLVRPSVQLLADAPQVAPDDSLPVLGLALAPAFPSAGDSPRDELSPELWLARVFLQPDDLVLELCSAAPLLDDSVELERQERVSAPVDFPDGSPAERPVVPVGQHSLDARSE